MTDFTHILRIDSSARTEGSVTRELTDAAINALAGAGPVQVTTRDVSGGIPFVTEDWVAANFTDPSARTEGQHAILADSDALVAELQAADVVVIGLPIYNFGVPAALKAWVDMIARARLTFRYTTDGPEGLLTGKRAVVLVASGGTAVNSAVDFATPYIRHALGFVGIDNVTVIASDQMGGGNADKLRAAKDHISNLTHHAK